MPPIYDADFFEEQRRRSTRSATKVVPFVLELTNARSVVDVGCGVGAWLSVFKSNGVTDILGLDGPWALSHSQLSADEFVEHDLTMPVAIPRRFDLVVSLEVAEHLPSWAADVFVDGLTKLGPIVLFSAAIPLQGGTSHVNEQWPDYWCNRFEARGFKPIDCLRMPFWEDPDVEWYYAQNSLIFAATEQYERLVQTIGSAGTQPAMRLVHPGNYLDKARRADIGLADALRMLPRLFSDAMRRRLPRRR